jgi:hypothetical protein
LYDDIIISRLVMMGIYSVVYCKKRGFFVWLQMLLDADKSNYPRHPRVGGDPAQIIYAQRTFYSNMVQLLQLR